MIIGVFGPRDFKDQKPYHNYGYVSGVLACYEPTLLISGGGGGVEELALRHAEEHGIAKEVVPPNIRAFGTKIAFVKRNEEIVNKVELVVLLWDGSDKFYVDLLATCIAKQKAIHIYHVE